MCQLTQIIVLAMKRKRKAVQNRLVQVELFSSFCVFFFFLYAIGFLLIKLLFFQVHGKWSSWTEFGECSTTCGGGTRSRTRLCNNPAPVNGLDCPGSNTDFIPCATQNCPGLFFIFIITLI